MNGTIIELHRDRGTGSLRGEDGKTYSFRRSVIRDCWFHDLVEGGAVIFEAGKPPRELEASLVRLVRTQS